MIYYILFSLFVYYGINSNKKINIFVFLAALIPGLRISSGKDTILYFERLKNIHDGYFLVDYEPLLNIIFYISSFSDNGINSSWYISNFIYSVIIIILYNIIISKFKTKLSKQTVFSISLIVVILIIDSSFNGMRVGLMIPIAIIFLITKKLPLFILAIAGHISAIFLGFYSLLKRHKFVLILLLILSLLYKEELISLIELNSRINSKYTRYTQTQNLSIFSGLVDLFIALILLLGANFKTHYRYILAALIIPILLLHIYVFSTYYGVFRIYRLMIIMSIYSVYKFGVYSENIIKIGAFIFVCNFLKQLIFLYGQEGAFLPFT